MDQFQLLGYNPNVTVYERKNARIRFWINYRLPNQSRVRRPCSNSKKDAGMKARIKQGQLINGNFDAYDRKKLGRFLRSEQRLNFDEAKNVYFELTANNKTPRTLKRDEYLLDVAFGYFKKHGAETLDDVTPLDCARLISWLKAKGLRRSSVQNYWKSISKLYTKLRKMKLIGLDNPMEDVELPKNGNISRDRIPTMSEVQSILFYLDARSVNSTYVSPLDAIIRFALYTGARIGEILHSEWGDFDLDVGYWHIKNKPDCPGVEGIGWSPKWRKERSVKLFPEAISVLQNLPKRETVGFVKDDEGLMFAVPANFVFPKRQVTILDNCPMKSKQGHYKCVRCREYKNKDACEYRVVTYSRCDSVKTAWNNLCSKTGIKDLHIHDLRRFFNRVILQEKLGFTHEESGLYIGNSEEVNREHYSPISIDTFERKFCDSNFNDLISGQTLMN